MVTSQGDLYTLAISAGLTPARAKTAAAIAIAESGGDPRAHNTKGLDNSYGYWQINMKGRLGPERLKLFGISSADQLFDPATNARAMAILSKQGTDFRPWSTYLSGAYLAHMGANLGGSAGVVDVGFWDRLKGLVPDGIPNPLAPVQDIGQLVTGFVKGAAWLSNSENWVRIAYVGGGLALGLLGVVMVLRETGPGRAVVGGVKTAAKATPAGRATAVASKAKAATKEIA
jgi:hypothetical protein